MESNHQIFTLVHWNGVSGPANVNAEIRVFAEDLYILAPKVPIALVIDSMFRIDKFDVLQAGSMRM